MPDRLAARSRRAVLAGVAGLAGLAGCIDATNTGDDAREARSTTVDRRGPDRLSFGTGFTENGVRAWPRDPVVQGSVLYRTDSGAVAVQAADGVGYLLVRLETGSSFGIEPPVAADLSLVAAGESVAGRTALDDVDAARVLPDVHDRPYDRESAEGWVLFPVERSTVASADDPRLVLQPTEAGRPWATWPLPGGVVDRLSRPAPGASITLVDVPNGVRAGDTLQVTVTAENAGDRDGVARFGVTLGDGAAARPVRLSVPAGESATWEGSLPVPADAGGSTTVSVRSASDDRSQSVTVAGTEG